MATVYRANRKATDADILRLNSVGLSLATIARALDCHPTTITLRLKSLGVEPADTRRSFMEDVFLELEPAQQEWLADQLSPEYPIKDFVRMLIQEAHTATARLTADAQASAQAIQASRRLHLRPAAPTSAPDALAALADLTWIPPHARGLIAEALAWKRHIQTRADLGDKVDTL